MRRSRAGEGEGTSDPELREFQELRDDEEDENWFRIDWHGEEYEDAWIMDRSENIDDLSENE